MVLNDEGVAIQELEHYRRAGGQSLVDTTPIGLGRDPLALQRISRATGLHIVMGTSFYVENAHPPWVADSDADELAALFVREIRDGVGDTGIKPGIIDEIGLAGIPRGWGRKKVGPMTPEEEKVVRAGARASVETGLTVGIHIDPIEPRATFPALDVLEAEGVSPDRIIVDHMDQVQDLDYHRAVAERGVYVEYDSLGREHYTEEWGYDFCWGHDSWRIQFAKDLVSRGHGEQLLFSQDVCLKTDLRKYGGVGYAHALDHVVPSLRAIGVAESAIRKILVDNPARALAHAPSSDVEIALAGAGAQEAR
jgi:phosphotriesterase-related protein